MVDKWIRVGLAALAATGLMVGGWAAFAPRSFYVDFPGAGRAWVAVDGPYNEHLVRDFGALNLALAAVTIVALVTLAPTAVYAAGAGWIVYQGLHLAYHLRHLDVYDTVDKAANVVLLTLGIVVPVILIVAVARRPRQMLR